MYKRRLFFAILCATTILSGIGSWASAAEETAYTIIVSDTIERAAKNLQNSISSVIGKDVSYKELDYRSPEAKEWIKRLDIKFVPYVIFGKAIQSYDKFSDMVKNGMIISKSSEYVIPDKMLASLGIMFFERPVKAGQLDVFIMSQCPVGNDALQKLDSYLTTNPKAFNVLVHYITAFNEFGINSPRGPEEIKEDIRQLLIQKYYPDQFWQYHRLYIQKNSFESICTEIGIDSNIVDSGKKEGIELLKNDFNLCGDLNISSSINSSPTFLWENQVLLVSIRQLYEILMADDVSYAVNIEKTEDVLPIIVFYGSKCPHCRKLVDNQAPRLKKEFGDRIAFIYYNIQVPQHAERKRDMEEEYGVLNAGRIPEVFVAGQALVGRREINKKLRNIIKKNISVKKKTSERIQDVEPTSVKSNGEKISSRFQTFTLLAIIGGGLLDGINPCAFSTIVFFLSFLALAGFSFRKIVLIGIFFILAVFLSYLGLGLGAFVWFENVRTFAIFSRYFDVTVGGLAILLGAASLYDYFRYKRKGTSEGILLRLPRAIKNIIHFSIGTLRNKGASGILKLLLVAFGLGVLVSLLESVCTGQVYVPTLSFMIKMNMMRVKAFLYLLLYNLMFIFPLVVVFLSTLFGIKSQWWARLLQSNLGRIKLITALFFFAIGALIMLI